MKLILSFCIIAIPGYIVAQTTTTTTGGQKNTQANSAYVTPVVTKTNTVPAAKNAPATRTQTASSNSGSSYSSGGNNSYNAGDRIVLFRAFRERSRDKKIIRQINKDQKAAKERTLELEEWKKQATAVIDTYKAGNSSDAADIMQSIQQFMPGGTADNPFQKSYNYTCIQILSEMSDYNGVIELTKSTPEIINDLPGAFTGYSNLDILSLKSIYTEALHHVSGIARARANWKAVADIYIPYIVAIEKDKNVIGLCYNIIAMRQFQLSLFDEGKLNIIKQLALYPNDEQIQFAIYQNLVDLISIAPHKNNRLVNFCQDAIEKILAKAITKKADAEFIYQLKYNKAILLLTDSTKLDQAEETVNSIKNVTKENQFAYNMLKSKIYKKQLYVLNHLLVIPTEKEIRQKEYGNYTPAQKHEYDSLFIAGYFDNRGPDYLSMSMKKHQQELDLGNIMLAGFDSLSAAQRLEMQIYAAESNIEIVYSYDMAEIEFEGLLIGDENNCTYLLRFAQVKVLLGKYKEAITILKKAIDNNNIEYELDMALADIYRNNTNEPKKAKENYILAFNKGAFLPDDVISFLGGIPTANSNNSKENVETPATAYAWIREQAAGKTWYDGSNPYPTFHEGLAVITIKHRNGYIDESGKQVIPMQYDNAYEFVDGKAMVKLQGKVGIIDKTGKIVIPLMYQSMTNFWRGLAAAKLDDKWGSIDVNNKIIIPFDYEDNVDFNEDGIGRARKNGKCGLIDKTTKILVPFKYDGLGVPVDGITVARKKDKWGFINMANKTVIPFKYQFAYQFQEGVAAVQINNKWGFIDKDGNELAAPYYDEVSLFYEGLAAVKLDNKWGFINKEFKLIIPMKYDDARVFIEGAAAVSIKADWGFINKEGQEIVPLIYSAADHQNHLLRVIVPGNQVLFFDNTGKKIE